MTPEARAGRLQAANDVLERGTEPFFESMVPKLLAKTTRETRPDLVDGALRMMRKMSPEDVAQVQRGMAARPDSVATLKTINVPTLLVTGDEDTMTGVNEAELMRQHIANSELFVIPKAGHYSPWEQPADAAKILRVFLDGLRSNAVGVVATIQDARTQAKTGLCVSPVRLWLESSRHEKAHSPLALCSTLRAPLRRSTAPAHYSASTTCRSTPPPPMA